MVLHVSLNGFVYAAGNAADGKKLAEKCVECHGLNGEGIAPKTKLAGLKAPAFKKAMEEYKSGKRTHPVMMQLSKELSNTDVANLAAYYATK
jgi:cytochrome c553